MYERTREKIELTKHDKLRFNSDWFPPLISVDFLASVNHLQQLIELIGLKNTKLLSNGNIIEPPGNLEEMFPIRGYCKLFSCFLAWAFLQYKSLKKKFHLFFFLFQCQNTPILLEFFQLTRSSDIIAPEFHSLTRTHNFISIQNQNTLISSFFLSSFTDQKRDKNSAA